MALLATARIWRANGWPRVTRSSCGLPPPRNRASKNYRARSACDECSLAARPGTRCWMRLALITWWCSLRYPLFASRRSVFRRCYERRMIDGFRRQWPITRPRATWVASRRWDAGCIAVSRPRRETRWPSCRARQKFCLESGFPRFDWCRTAPKNVTGSTRRRFASPTA